MAVAAVKDADPKELVSTQNQAYNAAWSRLRQAHREEYDALIDEEFAKRGLERRRRATSQQRAEREEKARKEKTERAFDKLLKENPALADYAKRTIGIL